MPLLGGLLGSIWGLVVALLGGLLGSIWGLVVALLGGLLGVLWGWVLLFSVCAAAVILNTVGVKDVYAVLHRIIDRGDTAGTDAVETVRHISPEAVTDERGRFSTTAFERVTGMTPVEFIHVFVISNGGRVKQRTLTTCLPWSKSTVSGLLDTLEREDVVKRISSGRENIVCTPDAAPDNCDERGTRGGSAGVNGE